MKVNITQKSPLSQWFKDHRVVTLVNVFCYLKKNKQKKSQS